ncbi:BSD domain-containing protein 1, partial [Cucurbita argyrosperma subsp. sororia]
MDLFSVFPGGDRASERSDSEEEHDGGGSVSNISNPSTSWSFGGLIKTLATKSESVISNYRRDLEELGSGLRKETSVIREVASRAVKDLPTTLDVGASVVQESLESVGEAIDDIGSAVWKSTSKIISHGSSTTRKLEYKQYNRFNTQLIAVQRDLNTYLEEPKDLENYKNWKLGFVLEDKEEEIDNLVKESDDVRETYRTVVPSTIVHEVFWSRYFYRLHKLKQAEEARVKLVKSAISAEDEEDLSWDVDEDDVKEGNIESSGTLSTEKRNSNSSESAKTGDSGDSCKDGDISIISSQLGEEDELGWDEIEDIGIIEEARGNDEQRIGLHKRLIMAEEEEDLSWEIEDEDEPAKA